MNEKILWDLSYGVYAITTWGEGKPTGCIANSAMQVAATPATIAVSVNHDNFTHHCIAECGRFAINVLGEKCDPLLIGKLGFFSGKDTDKFADIPYSLASNLPVLTDSCGYIVCEVINTMEAGTHTVFLGKVIAADVQKADVPMTYSYYHKVVKGKAPKNAPTYQGD